MGESIAVWVRAMVMGLLVSILNYETGPGATL